MYYITLFIEPLCLTGFITDAYGKQNRLVIKKIYLVSETESIATILSQFINEFTQISDKKRYILRLIMIDQSILQGSLVLPHTTLNDNELETYVDRSLSKLFRTNESLRYDYRQKQNNQTTSLTIIAYPEDKFNQWCRLCHQSACRVSINFIGILTDFVDNLINNHSSTPLFESLDYQDHVIGFNFLPWRERVRRAKKRRSLAILLGALLFSILLLC